MGVLYITTRAIIYDSTDAKMPNNIQIYRISDIYTF